MTRRFRAAAPGFNRNGSRPGARGFLAIDAEGEISPSSPSEHAPECAGWQLDDPVPARPSSQVRFVPLPAGAHRRIVAVREILAIETQENYSRVYLADGSKELVRRTMKDWVARLPASDFLRVHRTVLVNLPRVTAYRRAGHKAYFLHVPGLRRHVPVSRKLWTEVQRRRPGLECVR
jgi:DNA-binding LytR/AlgR family response regulator